MANRARLFPYGIPQLMMGFTQDGQLDETTAARGGLRPAPDCRPRRALLHLSYSSAPLHADGTFVTHDPKPDRHPVLTIGRLVGVAPYPVPCEREYLFGGGDCQPINTLSSGRWTSTSRG